MPDKERVIELLSTYGVSGRYLHDLYDEIEECFSPELEAARLWDRVVSFVDVTPCEECPFDKCDTDLCCIMEKIVDALEGEVKG